MGQQKHGVDCGAYAILHTIQLIERIIRGEMSEDMVMEFPANATKDVRKELKNKLTKIKQKETESTKLKENHDEQIDTKKLVEKVTKEIIEQMKQKEEPCGKHISNINNKINNNNNNNNKGINSKITKTQNIEKKDNNSLKNER